MNTRIIATALLMAGMSAPLMAQNAQPAPQPPVSQDPNAGYPTGAVPPSAADMVPDDSSVPRNPSAPVGSAANPVVVGGNLTPPPPPPKDYPICTKTITDSCVNKSQAKRHRH